jgi:hypothetical protein
MLYRWLLLAEIETKLLLRILLHRVATARGARDIVPATMGFGLVLVVRGIRR